MSGHEEDIGPQEVNAPIIALVGIIGAVLTFLCIVAVQAYFNWVLDRTMKGKGLDQPSEQLVSTIGEQQNSLIDYRWKDQQKGLITIPISQAKEDVLNRYLHPAPAKDAPAAKGSEPAKKG